MIRQTDSERINSSHNYRDNVSIEIEMRHPLNNVKSVHVYGHVLSLSLYAVTETNSSHSYKDNVSIEIEMGHLFV